MCLKQENILGAQISQENYETIAQQLVIWVFEVENIKSLIQIEEKTFFDVIYLFFVSPVVDTVNRNSATIKIKCPSTLSEQEIEMLSMKKINLSIFHFVFLLENMDYPILNIIISILYFTINIESEMIKENNDSETTANSTSSLKYMWFYFFIGKIIKLKKFHINPNICHEAVIKLLEKPAFLENLNKEKNAQDLISLDEKELEKSEFIILIIKYCEKEISKEQMDEIIRIAEISPLYIKQ